MKTLSNALILALAAHIFILFPLGCMMTGPGQIVPGRSITFNHALHAEELECDSCHSGYAEEESAGMPSLAVCRLCHAEEDEPDLEPHERVSNFIMNGDVRWSNVTALPDYVQFSHSKHYEAGVECESCHGDVANAAAITMDFRVEKPQCLECHAEKKVSLECQACHSEINREWAPPSHERHWIEMHGQIVRAGPSEHLTEQCSMCHQESFCTECHLDMPPRSHSNFWRLRGHGIDARVDRQSCFACHRTHFCERCHAETRPLSHGGMWGDPSNIHCLGCHGASPDNGCFVCHRGTPSHVGTPKPPGHTPGMNCRQCHGLTAPLPHADNGDNCNDCHH